MISKRCCDVAKTRSGFSILVSSHAVATLILVLVLFYDAIFWLPIPFCLILPFLYLCEIRRQAPSSDSTE
jgi:hypothetical protein